jgi:hypothetical protein
VPFVYKCFQFANRVLLIRKTARKAEMQEKNRQLMAGDGATWPERKIFPVLDNAPPGFRGFEPVNEDAEFRGDRLQIFGLLYCQLSRQIERSEEGAHGRTLYFNVSRYNAAVPAMFRSRIEPPF